MSNLSQIKRQAMLDYIAQLKELHNDDESIIALNKIENALNEKKYGLVWEEHNENVYSMLSKNIPVFTEFNERKIESDIKGNYNFLLEGDNLHSLNLLEKTHNGHIDVIYIDPPYNLGKKDFFYNDSYVDEDDGYSHSKWISFMNYRLRKAYNLLSKEGFIAISIDENEYAQLKLLCDEIFGEDNRLITLHIQVRYDNKSLNEKNDWQPVMEYILIYAKSKNNFYANRPQETYGIDKFIYSIEELSNGEEYYANNRKVKVFKKGEWKLTKNEKPDMNLLKETWISGSIYSDTGHGTMYQRVVEPRFEQDGPGAVYKIYGIGDDGLGYRYYTNPRTARGTRGKMYTGLPTERREELESGGSVKYLPITNYYNYSAEFGNIRHEGGVPFNNGKKPIKLIQQLINFHRRKDIIVLDFFAGSGSTAHAVIQQNKEDGGNRKYILCTNNENNICEEITYKRLKNIQENLPHNLKYFRTDFVSKLNEDDEMLSMSLLEHIKEMVELENMCEIDGKNRVLILTQEELEEWFNGDIVPKSNVYLPSYILLSREMEVEANDKGVKFIDIPDYYFIEELREVNEL